MNEQNQYLSTFMWVMKREFTVIKDSLHQDREFTVIKDTLHQDREFTVIKDILDQDREFTVTKDILDPDRKRVYCYQRYSRPRQKESLLLSKIF